MKDLDEKNILILNENEAFLYLFIYKLAGKRFFLKDVEKILNKNKAMISNLYLKKLKNSGIFEKYKSSRNGIIITLKAEFNDPSKIKIKTKNAQEFKKKFTEINKEIESFLSNKDKELLLSDLLEK